MLTAFNVIERVLDMSQLSNAYRTFSVVSGRLCFVIGLFIIFTFQLVCNDVFAMNQQISPAAPSAPLGIPLQIKATDGTKIFAIHYSAVAPRALILFFHQGNSNYAEYYNIAPRLMREGYSSLAIDERHGGDAFNKINETVKFQGKDSKNIDAFPDLEAALKWGATQNLPIVVWGSSDSASLVFGLAAKYPNRVKAVLSFSAEMTDVEQDGWTQAAASKTIAPVFITSAATPTEVSAAHALFSAVGSVRKVHYVAKTTSIHGSSTIDHTRNPNGAEANLSVVLNFLKEIF
ncbi:alpha/beta hydrolase [Undibacterium jejuense]|uniref:Alpha/beta hydrolase n=1 Tax=Undibacterium jejuense TaxID=1344949 RepID=A0A923HJ11_9BURK|nr:alpha/beta hydrolase [Undibacterium jejuense]MBC3863313.1 alpha/beta hydrolase [Undibacterium jejuense]